MSIPASELLLGRVFEEVVVTNLSRTQIVRYAGASDDFNPLHTDEIFATEVAGYPSVIAHGMLTMGLTAKAVTNLVGNEQLVRFGGRFVGMVVPGDELVTRMEVTSRHQDGDDLIVELDVATQNQQRALVYKGSAAARFRQSPVK